MMIQKVEASGQVAKWQGRAAGCKNRNSLTAFVLSIFCLTVLPRLLSYGMFLDGVTYASIARNLAQGFGSFWRLYYTDMVYPQFYQHPPLGFFLQSFAYRIWGDSLRIEAFWGLGVGLVILILISLIWRHTEDNTPAHSGAWLPLLMFVTLPMTSWLLANNMLEGTMTVFSTLAALLAICSLYSASKPIIVLSAFLSGLAIFCAILTKGPVGFFPFSIPAVWFITAGEKKQWQRSVSVMGMMFLGFVVPFILVLAGGESLKSLSLYYSQQVVASLSGTREKGTNNFWIVSVILREIIVPVIIGAIVWRLAKLKERTKNKLSFGMRFWFYLLIALGGSLPMVLSPKQMGWYIFPSLPFYSLAAASLFDKPFAHLQDILLKTKRRVAVIWIIAAVVFVSAIGWMFAENRQLRRQKEFHHDFSIQALNIPGRQVISVYPPELQHEWELVANMQRQFGMSLSDSLGHDYLLTTVEWQGYIDSLKKYKKIHPPQSARYVFYIRTDFVQK
jgi:4-amino-4-deoxy-L-arabinose transferase-like glycosyltransferase